VPKVEDFFKVSSHDEDEEMKEASQQKEERDSIEQEEVEQFIAGLDLLNSVDFDILSMSRLPNVTTIAQQIAINEGFSKFLMTSSDRSLRLYGIDYQALAHRKKGIQLLNEFSDVINKKKWTNPYFFKLGPNQRLEAKGQSIAGISGYQQLLLDADPNHTSRTQRLVAENLDAKVQQHDFSETEGFVSTIGESGSNELQYFNSSNYQLMQKIELSQEGCIDLATHSGCHFSIMMVTTNGSLFQWNTRPAKIIQPLAPYFTEIDENVEYIEREDEFEEELCEEDPAFARLPEDEKKKIRFAQRKLDVETPNPNHLLTNA